MSVQISIDSTDSASRAIIALAEDRQVRARLVRNLAKHWHKAGQVVVGHAVKDRFTGKGPFPHAQNKLGVRSGRLRRAVRTSRPQVDATTGAVSVSMGSNVSYFGIHEFGFQGKVQVRGHSRRNVSPIKVVRGKATKASQSKAARQRRGGASSTSQVRPHARRVKIEARAPLGTEIRSERGRGEFRRAMRDAINQTYREVMK